jgi:drug/metabolite transporter (DMT)-like permease
MKKQPILVILSYLTIYLVWGSTYFFIRQSVASIPVLWVIAIRWTIGGVLLLAVSLARGKLRPLPSLRNVLSSIVLGLLLIVGGNGLITLAERTIDSYIAALLASATPIIVAVFDAVLLRKKLTKARIAGVLAGFGGVAVLLYNGQSVGASLTPAVLIGLLGVLSWGLATSLGHRFPVSGDSTVNSAVQMLCIGLAGLVICAFIGPAPSELAAAMSTASLVGVLYLGIFGSLGFAAFTYLVSVEPAERVVSYALVNPLIALFIGVGLAAEPPTPYLWYGFPLVLVGLGIMLYGERLAAWTHSKLSARG